MHKKTLVKAAKNRTIRFAHVKGHSGHKWNELADKLATMGANRQHGESVPGKVWTLARLDGGLLPQVVRYAQKATLKLCMYTTSDTTHIQATIQQKKQDENQSWRVAPNSQPWHDQNMMGKDVDEITRIIRCTDDFGTLNILPTININDET